MKSIRLIILFASLLAPAFADAPKAIPKNESRKQVDAFTSSIFERCGERKDGKPAATSLPLISLKLPRRWHPAWQITPTGDAMIIRYSTKEDKDRLAYGGARIFITTKPFTAELKEAPAVLDEGVAVQYEVQRWLPQKWTTETVPALKKKVRCYQNFQSGGADNAEYSTEPFSVKSSDGKTVWVVVTIESAFKKKGMTLKKALKALTLP